MVTAIQPVFAGGQIVNGNKLADLALEVSRYQMRQSEDEVAPDGGAVLLAMDLPSREIKDNRIVESLVGESL